MAMKRPVAHLVCTAKKVIREEGPDGQLMYYACPGAQVIITDDEQGEKLEKRLLARKPKHWKRVGARRKATDNGGGVHEDAHCASSRQDGDGKAEGE